MNSIDWIATILFLAVGHFTGLLRPTGLWSRRDHATVTTGRGLCFSVLFLAALVLLDRGATPIWERLQIDLTGTIVARQDVSQSAETHGPASIYSLRRNDGSLTNYTAAISDSSLPRMMPVGTPITKRRWDLSYTVNGQRVDDFPLMNYVVWYFATGLACLAGAVVLLAMRGSSPLVVKGLP